MAEKKNKKNAIGKVTESEKEEIKFLKTDFLNLNKQ